MKTPEWIDDAVVTDDEWAQVQLQIARRADEWARSRERQGKRYTDRECWLDAERLVLGRRPERVLV